MNNVVLIFILAFTYTLKAQTDISTAYNSTYSGQNIAISFAHTFSFKNEFGLGVRYNLGTLAMADDQNNIFLKRLFPTELQQKLGFETFYHRNLFSNLKTIKSFVFYDFQFAYSTTRTRLMEPHSYDTNGDVLYKEYLFNFGPFTWIEQNIGFGFKAHITESLHLMQKIGVGTCLIIGIDDSLLKKRVTQEFAWLIQVGLVYRLRE